MSGDGLTGSGHPSGVREWIRAPSILRSQNACGELLTYVVIRVSQVQGIWQPWPGQMPAPAFHANICRPEENLSHAGRMLVLSWVWEFSNGTLLRWEKGLSP